MVAFLDLFIWCVCMHMAHVKFLQRSEEGLESFEVELKAVVSYLTWVLSTELLTSKHS